MQRGVKVAVLVLLIIGAVAAVLYAVRRSDIGGPKKPEWYRDRPVEKIDMESMELMTKPMSEWESLGHENQRYKNPGTGKYTMVPAIPDPATGKKVPVPASMLAPVAPPPRSEVQVK